MSARRLGQCPEPPAGVGRIGEPHLRRAFGQGPQRRSGFVRWTLIEEDGRRQGAVAHPDSASSFIQGRLLTKISRSGLQNFPDRGGHEVAAEVPRRLLLFVVAEGPADGRQGVLEHGRRVEVEGTLLVALFFIGVVVDPDRRGADVFRPAAAHPSPNAVEHIGETDEARIGSGERRGLRYRDSDAGQSKLKPTPWSRMGAPIRRQIELPFDELASGHRRASCPGNNLRASALAEGGPDSGRAGAFHRRQDRWLELVSAVAAVLLALPGHPSTNVSWAQLLSVFDGGGHQALEGRLGQADLGLIGPGESPAPHPDIAYLDSFP